MLPGPLGSTDHSTVFLCQVGKQSLYSKTWLLSSQGSEFQGSAKQEWAQLNKVKATLLGKTSKMNPHSAQPEWAWKLLKMSNIVT